uniref:Uncharacterized protein n=1 Tax=Panagrolaimus sp. PS1159 TaxID=55785 RepID=A0AC35GXQ4_9BILA
MYNQALVAYFSFLVLASKNIPAPRSRKESLRGKMKKQMEFTLAAMKKQRQSEEMAAAAAYARKKNEFYA